MKSAVKLLRREIPFKSKYGDFSSVIGVGEAERDLQNKVTYRRRQIDAFPGTQAQSLWV